MTKDFNYHKLDSGDKKKYIIHQVVLFIMIALIIFIAINRTNPVLETTTQKVKVTMGGMFKIGIIALAFTNRLKKVLKTKFTGFLIFWFILASLNSIMDTLIFGIGAAIIPLAIDDIIMSAYWTKVWYNKYD